MRLWLFKGCDVRHILALKTLSNVRLTLATTDLISETENLSK